jgi:putative hemolysin
VLLPKGSPVMPTDLIIELAAILLLIAANGVFAGTEIALVAVRDTRLRELIAKGSGSAKAALTLKQQPEHLLATVQVAITIVSATAAALGGASSSTRLAPYVAQLPWVGAYAEPIALALVVAVVSFLSVVLGELVPKSLALRSADTFALCVARPLLWLSQLVAPVVRLLTWSSNLVLRPFGDRPHFREPRYSPEELQQLVASAYADGRLHARAAEIVSRALSFPELRARDVMVPRQRLVALPRNAGRAELRRAMTERPHTRVLVYGDGVDDIIGYVNVKDVLARDGDEALQLEALLRPARFVPACKSAADLLTEMQAERTPLVLVLDEHIGFAGMVTLADLLEELVGALTTEHAVAAGEPLRSEGEHVWLVQASIPVRELNRELGLQLPDDGDYNTLAGLCIEVFGRIPRAGERRRLQRGIELEIVDAGPRAIGSVRGSAMAPAP